MPADALPADAILKEYKEYVQQKLILERRNVKYRIAVYYSFSERRTYRAPFPEEYRGAFGQGIISLTQLLTHGANVTQGRIEALYESLGIEISSGTISNFLTGKADWVIKEREDILYQGIERSLYTQADSTKSVERGKTMATQIICSDRFTAFLTMPGKSRLDVLAAIQGESSAGLRICLNKSSPALMKLMKVSQKTRCQINKLLPVGQSMLISELMDILENPASGITPYNRVRVAHALALSHYGEQRDFPVIEWLLSDDAGEYTKIARQSQALCWIHDARYYRKLIPRTTVHKVIVEDILKQYWAFYERLKGYRKLNEEERKFQKLRLKEDFETLFKRETDYHQVNQCLNRTYQNKDKLLAVLENPVLPLHNNAAELGARRVVRKRDISLHTWSSEGTRIRDAFMSIIDTAAKQGVNALKYIQDRASGRIEMVSLADLIRLGERWFPPIGL